MDLTGKVVVVTGGAEGIGRALCESSQKRAQGPSSSRIETETAPPRQRTGLEDDPRAVTSAARKISSNLFDRLRPISVRSICSALTQASAIFAAILTT